MIQKNLSFHYCAIIILVILLVGTIMRRMIKGRVNRSFLCVVSVALLSTMLDIWAVMLDNQHGTDIFAKNVAHMSYLIVHGFTLPACISYMLNLTDTIHIFKQKRIFVALLHVPLTVSVIMVLLNPVTHNIFYLNDSYDYTRGKYFFVLYTCALIYLLLGIMILFISRRMIRKRYLLSLGVVYICEIVAAVIQSLHPELLVEMFGMAAGLLFVSLMIQRPEELIDIDTQLYKMNAYIDMLHRSFRNKKRFRIIMVNVTNYSSIRELIGFDQSKRLMRKIAQYLEALNREQKLGAALYYLERGKFRLVVDENYFGRVKDVAALINERMKESMDIHQMSINLVANICILDCPDDISDVEALLSFGDVLDTIAFTGEIMWASEQLNNTRFDMMREMDSIIENALANNHFSVYYQPIYSVNEKRFLSAEALIRLKDEKYGFVSPDLFIPVAERSGAIHKIGDFVLEEVCQFISSDEYKKLGIDYIEVNLSVAQCMQPKLVEHIMNILNRYKVRPDQINLEITETAATISQQALQNNIEKLTSAGVRFSLDDFGTGYSNMQRVVSLPFEIIKLDKSFTEIYDNPKLAIVLTNTIRMIKAMDMKIVVEGVETEEMVKLFAKLDCEYIQGYFFSKPIPREDFTKFIQASM